MRIGVVARIVSALGFASALRAPSSCVNKGQIALVFSDGPVDGTNDVLNTLSMEDVKATFMFSIVNIDHPGVADTIRQAVEEGHTVGLRTNPLYDFSDMSEEDIREAISMELSVLEEVAESKIKYISINQPDVNDQTVLQVIDELNLTLVNYNYNMYGTEDDAEDMLHRWNLKLKSVRPQSISYIVLQHDQKESELGIVPDVVADAQSSGFAFVNMDECLDGATMEGAAVSSSDDGGIRQSPKRKENSAAAVPVSALLGFAAFLAI